MDHPFGRWAVAIAGLIVLGYGVYQVFRAIDCKSSRSPRLMIIGAGLIAYGVYAFINARYRRIKASPAAGAAHSR